jgi:hypothetical protein
MAIKVVKASITETAPSSARSPRYPIIGLREALDRARQVYDADHRNRIPKELVAQHIGYTTLNGKSLGVVSAIGKYGLLEGKADQMWISERAIVIFEHPPGDPQRVAALKAAASEPELFNELSEAFPGKVSDQALRSHLIIKRKFLPEAADRAIRSYRETRELVESESQGYIDSDDAPEQPAMTPHVADQTRQHSGGFSYSGPEVSATHRTEASSDTAGTRREVIDLDEGEAVITFPASLSLASVEDLEVSLLQIIKKAKRRAGAEQPSN